MIYLEAADRVQSAGGHTIGWITYADGSFVAWLPAPADCQPYLVGSFAEHKEARAELARLADFAADTVTFTPAASGLLAAARAELEAEAEEAEARMTELEADRLEADDMAAIRRASRYAEARGAAGQLECQSCASLLALNSQSVILPSPSGLRYLHCPQCAEHFIQLAAEEALAAKLAELAKLEAEAEAATEALDILAEEAAEEAARAEALAAGYPVGTMLCAGCGFAFRPSYAGYAIAKDCQPYRILCPQCAETEALAELEAEARQLEADHKEALANAGMTEALASYSASHPALCLCGMTARSGSVFCSFCSAGLEADKAAERAEAERAERAEARAEAHAELDLAIQSQRQETAEEALKARMAELEALVSQPVMPASQSGQLCLESLAESLRSAASVFDMTPDQRLTLLAAADAAEAAEARQTADAARRALSAELEAEADASLRRWRAERWQRLCSRQHDRYGYRLAGYARRGFGKRFASASSLKSAVSRRYLPQSAERAKSLPERAAWLRRAKRLARRDMAMALPALYPALDSLRLARRLPEARRGFAAYAGMQTASGQPRYSGNLPTLSALIVRDLLALPASSRYRHTSVSRFYLGSLAAKAALKRQRSADWRQCAKEAAADARRWMAEYRAKSAEAAELEAAAKEAANRAAALRLDADGYRQLWADDCRCYAEAMSSASGAKRRIIRQPSR